MDINVGALSPAGQANYQKVLNGQPVYAKFQEMAKDPMRYNEELLLKILHDNRNTEYGKKYDFAGIHSIEEFQKRVPVTKYDDYAEAIIRETEGGEKDLLCVYDIIHYNKFFGLLSNVS